MILAAADRFFANLVGVGAVFGEGDITEVPALTSRNADFGIRRHRIGAQPFYSIAFVCDYKGKNFVCLRNGTGHSLTDVWGGCDGIVVVCEADCFDRRSADGQIFCVITVLYRVG